MDNMPHKNILFITRQRAFNQENRFNNDSSMVKCSYKQVNIKKVESAISLKPLYKIFLYFSK
jgi:hypothetical protein